MKFHFAADFVADGLRRLSVFFSPAWWRAFQPARTRISTRERLRLVIGALIGIFLTGLLCHLIGGDDLKRLPWLVAPLGASAVLVFALPASPMAQPWAVVGGNTLSALVGIVGVHGVYLLGAPELAAALAVATAIALMLTLRCLHPPGGATALMMVLGGIGDPAFAVYPVMLNTLLLVLAGIVYNNATRRIYSKKPEVVAQVMTRNVQVAGMQQHLVDLVPLFGTTGHHHIPILDEDKKLVGIITQSNLVAALGRAADPAT